MFIRKGYGGDRTATVCGQHLKDTLCLIRCTSSVGNTL